MHSPEEVVRSIDSIGEKMVGSVCSATHRGHVAWALAKFKINVTVETDHNVNPGMIIVCGSHTPWLKRHNVEVNLIYKEGHKRVLITDEIWGRLRFDLIQVVLHEMIHRQQQQAARSNGVDWESEFRAEYKSKNPIKEAREKEDYLGSTLEIYAMAHCVSMELQEYCSRMNPLDVLRAATSVTKSESWTLYDYMRTFDWDTSHPVIKRLIKFTVKWIETKNAHQVEQSRKALWIVNNSSRKPEQGEYPTLIAGPE